MKEISTKQFIIIVGVIIVFAVAGVLGFRMINARKANLDNTANQAEPKKTSGVPLGILITDPDLKATVTSPVLVRGSAAAENFDHNAINFKIIDEAGAVLGEGSSIPGEKQSDGNFAFEAQVNFSGAKPGLGFIMINDNPNFKFPIQF